MDSTPQETEKVAEATTWGDEFVQEAELDNLVKQAELEGRAMAVGFMEEFNKVAVETHPIQITPDHGQTPGNVNPTVQVSTAGGAVGSPASAIINSLLARSGQSGGTISGPAGIMARAETGVAAPPNAAEIARLQESQAAAAKTAGDYIIEQLYNIHLA